MVDVPVDVRIGVNLTSLLLMIVAVVREVADNMDSRIISLFVCFCHDQAQLKTCDDGTSEGNFLIIIDYFLQIFLMFHLDRS